MLIRLAKEQGLLVEENYGALSVGEMGIQLIISHLARFPRLGRLFKYCRVDEEKEATYQLHSQLHNLSADVARDMQYLCEVLQEE